MRRNAWPRRADPFSSPVLLAPDHVDDQTTLITPCGFCYKVQRCCGPPCPQSLREESERLTASATASTTTLERVTEELQEKEDELAAVNRQLTARQQELKVGHTKRHRGWTGNVARSSAV